MGVNNKCSLESSSADYDEYFDVLTGTSICMVFYVCDAVIIHVNKDQRGSSKKGTETGGF